MEGERREAEGEKKQASEESVGSWGEFGDEHLPLLSWECECVWLRFGYHGCAALHWASAEGVEREGEGDGPDLCLDLGLSCGRYL